MNTLIPELPAAALDALTHRLNGAKVYLEYGSGGSTAVAARLGVGCIVSVESSADWVASVRRGVADVGGRLHLLHADIGKTGDWGRPVDRKALERWPFYALSGWRRLRELGLSPDLVLIDGRFRVACFCLSLLSAQPGTVILFDDYAERPAYHVVQRLCSVAAMHDRMAEFHVPDRIDAGAVAACLIEHLYAVD